MFWMVRNGKAIRAARKTIRLNGKEFAKICSIEPETLSRIENGKLSVPGYVDMILSLLERDESAIRFAMDRAGLE
jgi:transcriptional regulator with XRE-family HTH domain